MSKRGYYRGEKLTKRLRKCPRCGKKHRWPTEDKLCYKCEGEWAEESKRYLI